MRFPNYNPLLIITLLLFNQLLFGQIIFHELPRYQLKQSDEVFFNITQTRSIIPLNGTWNVYSPEDKDKRKFYVEVPSVFEGEGELVFEKEFILSTADISLNKMKVVFLGLNYTADISVNNVIIYRHTGGEFPFQLELPRDILKANEKNVLSVHLHYELDSENTIPVKQRFLSPRNFGGIIRDVYIHTTPNISVSDLDLNSSYNFKNRTARITGKAKVENRDFRKNDTIPANNNLRLKISISSPLSSAATGFPESEFELKFNQEKTLNYSIDIQNPVLWTPSQPNYYTVTAELYRAGNLVDVNIQHMAIYSFGIDSDTLKLNGSPIELKGVTYIPSFYDYGTLLSYEQMEKDLSMIRETGFNAVRITRTVPHPYILQLCRQYGLLAFVEIPVYGVPGRISQEQNFIARSRNYLNGFLSAYKKYNVAAVGLGGSYLASLENHRLLLSDLAAQVKSDLEVLTYASFGNKNISEISGIDLYGIEILNASIKDEFNEISRLRSDLGSGRIFISEATYVVNSGHSNGYVNNFSFEAQAKFFEDLIEYSDQTGLPGFFINSMYDFRGDYASMVSGYTPENLYTIGIMGEDRLPNRIGYNVVNARLTNAEKVTIPIGSKRDDSPMVFILFGIALALVTGILINSGKKFREDASRALLRPYNFFADIRDQRIMSGYHSTILGLVIACVFGLVVSNLLYYFRTDVVFEKLLLSFGSPSLIKAVSYLSWHPVMSLIWITDAVIILLLLLTIIVRAASFFVRTRVYVSSVFFTLIWSFLPFIILIPAGMILYRILEADVANLYIYITLIIFFLWCLQRLLKGIYVIFDVNPGSVYFYSFLFIVVFAGGLLLYFDLTNSLFSYLKFTLAHYKIFG